VEDHDEHHFQQEFIRGIQLFNEKEFFDCHDAWEELWHEERGERRLFLQGMIQSAVGSYHLSNGNITGAISQYMKALDKLQKYPPDFMGLDLEKFRAEIERCLAGACLMRDRGAKYEVDGSFFPVVAFI
jgi:predicted metal-dependent hydrolase